VVSKRRVHHVNTQMRRSSDLAQMRLITWNVAGRVSTLSEQAAAVASVGADVVCLQEVTVRTAPLWTTALTEAGLDAIETALDGLPPRPTTRRLAVLTAARGNLRRAPAKSTYCHSWRTSGLSDHSALVVDVQPPAATAS
jgi:hypothetical protein